MHTLAAPSSGTQDVLGFVGYGGLALAITVYLVGACRKNNIKPRPALIVAFIAGSCYLQAGGIWRIPQRLVEALYGLAHVGHASGGPLGTVGPGAIALTLVAIAWVWDLKQKGSVALGISMAVVFAGSGGIWTYLHDMGSGVATQVGA